MKYRPPQSVELTDEEAKLYSQIPESPSHDGWHAVADAMEALFKSLEERQAIPEIRLQVFCDPNYAETGNKSRQEVFESNGTVGRDICRHPHFIPYLRYFIHGPNLPKTAIDGLCKILNDDVGTSGMVLDQYRKHARACVRQHRLNASDAATEFFRLGVEIGMEIHSARTLRDAARTTR
ncbi:MAG: hypothetical protein AABP62_00350 [Planctomycetota bacterium]